MKPILANYFRRYRQELAIPWLAQVQLAERKHPTPNNGGRLAVIAYDSHTTKLRITGYESRGNSQNAEAMVAEAICH
jgi:hypothetical protein